jgi:hemoglobin/transferrin/lactoferrin receptor protein
MPKFITWGFCNSHQNQTYAFRSVLLASVAVIFLNQNALAQDATKSDDQEDKTIVLDPISIDAKADVLTGGVQLGDEDLERSNPQDIKDVFRQEPGVEVGSPLSISQKIYVNGIEETNLNVDFDGARQANKTYHHQGTSIVDPGLLKAVKVETGVAPADAGPQALAGSITLETKDGRDMVDPGEHIGGFIKLSYNDNTSGFTEDIALAVRHEGFDAMVYGTMEGGKSYKDGDGQVVLGSEPDAQNGIFKLGFTGTNGYRIKLSGTRYDDISLRDARTNFSLPDSFGLAHHDYSRQSVTASFGDETPTKWLDPKFSISQTKTHLDTFQYASSRAIIARVESLNGKASNTFTTSVGKLTAGGDFFVDEGTGGVTSVGHTDRKEKASNYGVFGQMRSSWSDEFRTSLGGRFDFNKLVGNKSEELKNNGASGNINAEYDVTEEFMAYGGVGSVFGGVPMTEVGVQTSDRNYDNVEASRSYNIKFGGLIETHGFTVDGHLFQTKIMNSHDLTSATRSTMYTLLSKGGNLSVKYDYDNGFLRGAYSHTKFRLNGDIPTDGSTNYYQGILLGDKFTFEASHNFQKYDVRIGTTNEWVLENDDTQEARGFALNGYYVSNVYGEWFPKWAEAVSLRLDLKNLFDRAYADRANAGSYSTNSNVAAYNDPGRTFLLTAKWDF